MPDNLPTFLDEATLRREAIANQLAHLDSSEKSLKRELQLIERNRLELLNIDAGYVEAIRRATEAPAVSAVSSDEWRFLNPDGSLRPATT